MQQEQALELANNQAEQVTNNKNESINFSRKIDTITTKANILFRKLSQLIHPLTEGNLYPLIAEAHIKKKTTNKNENTIRVFINPV